MQKARDQILKSLKIRVISHSLPSHIPEQVKPCMLSYIKLSLNRFPAHPALFLHVKNTFASENDPVDSEILEVQAVDPPASRSWFMDNDTVLEGSSRHSNDYHPPNYP
jgi:hypothetical protein